MQRNEDKAFPAEGDQQACGLNRTSYPNSASEKMAEDFFLDRLLCPLTGVIPQEHEEGLHDDLYHMIRYGVLVYNPRTKGLRLTRNLSPEEWQALWQRIDAENP